MSEVSHFQTPEFEEYQRELLAQAENPEPLCDELLFCVFEPEPGSKLGWTVLKHPLVFAVPYMPAWNYMYNRQFEAKKQDIEESLVKREWSRYIFMHERPYRFEALYSIRQKMTGQEYWEILSLIWTDSENLWQVGTTRLRSMLSYQKEYRCFFMDGDEQGFLYRLPDKLRVFRGHRTHNKNGFSWTLAYHKAQWFAQRFGDYHDGGRGRVTQGIVDKAHVKGLLMGRNEMEIVVHTRAVQDVKPVLPLKRPPYLEAIRDELILKFALQGRTDHGPGHWEKVERNGIELCKLTPEADPAVVQLFAIFHDSCRRDEMRDPGHGSRAAKLLTKMRNEGSFPWINDDQFVRLELAVRRHNGSAPVDCPTIGTCFDADRLDILRVGLVPDPKLLSTAAGKKMIGII